MIKKVTRFLVSQDGATMVEYAIMVALVAAACTGAVSLMSEDVQNLFGVTIPNKIP
jgi:pilus assembly protein Flp/PilA